MEAVMRRMAPLRKVPMCRWRARGAIPMLNRKQIHKEEWRDVLRRRRPVLCPLQRRSVHATSLSGSLG